MFNRKLIFWAACLGMLLFGIAMITLGSVIPDLKMKLGLNELSAGTLFSILPFGILTGSLLFGPIADRHGYRLLLSLSCLLLFAGFEGIAWSESSALLKFFVFMVGVGGGSVNGATNALVSDISQTGKGADLNLLGVFYGIGALGMPLLIGLLKSAVSFEGVIAAIGLLCFLIALFFTLLRFPPPKQDKGVPLSVSIRLLGNGFLLVVSFFLFFESSLEGIINNWTTLFVMNRFQTTAGNALFSLSAFVTGMAVMRIITGGFLRNVSEKKILPGCFTLTLAGLIMMKTGTGWITGAAALFIVGAGLSYGFPVMLGFIGSRFANLSGSAMSIAFVIALIGNMAVNYAMGYIASIYGIGYLLTVASVEFAALVILSLIIFKKL